MKVRSLNLNDSLSILRHNGVVGHFRCKCPINFSLSGHYDKLKLIGHQTDPLRHNGLPQVQNLQAVQNQMISLCNTRVLCVSVVVVCRIPGNHRDTENTEVAQRNQTRSLSTIGSS